MHDESLDKPRDVNKLSQSDVNKCSEYNTNPCLVNLISKDTHLVFTMSRQASILQAFSKPCLVKLDMKRHSPSNLYVSASLTIQQAFSKHCPVKFKT